MNIFFFFFLFLFFCLFFNSLLLASSSSALAAAAVRSISSVTSIFQMRDTSRPLNCHFFSRPHDSWLSITHRIGQQLTWGYIADEILFLSLFGLVCCFRFVVFLNSNRLIGSGLFIAGNSLSFSFSPAGIKKQQQKTKLHASDIFIVRQLRDRIVVARPSSALGLKQKRRRRRRRRLKTAQPEERKGHPFPSYYYYAEERRRREW